MALQNTRLMDLAYVAATTPASVYANPASTKTFVRGVILHNTNTTAEAVVIHWVPDSSGSLGTAGNTNKLFSISLIAGETLLIEFPLSIVLTDTNDSIQAATTTASKVNIAVLGDTDA